MIASSTCIIAATNLPVLPAPRDLIDHADSLLGKTVLTSYWRHACERAQSVRHDQVFFGLDAVNFQHFTAMLDAPPSAVPVLRD